ncbi:hypothetical protein PPNSA23_41740 [Phyllobacterium phragmitis]|uniref:Uncharacterized protein n=1 Tax=Phyllobacterium phragmitis TaxID=2670329 RepID=A0ABQ0H5S3_9HYPH
MLSKDADYIWARPALLARKFRTVELRAGLPSSLCGRPLRCKRYLQRDEHRSGASMCSACLRSTRWLLALMNSADHIPNHVIALEALCSPGFVRSPVKPVCHHH